VDVYRGGKLRKMKRQHFGQDQQHRWISAGARMNTDPRISDSSQLVSRMSHRDWGRGFSYARLVRSCSHRRPTVTHRFHIMYRFNK
jgi:hypothetical protein